jgi:beta-glucosidase
VEKYRDVSLSFDERAEDLVSRMTLEEKAGQLLYNAPAVERLDIPAYNWWSEALHGVARAGTATMFPQAIGLAAMFDDEEIHTMAAIIAGEGRARYNAFIKEGDRGIFKGLTFWSPNVNIFRDPRWGRGQESYGEDPYLSSRLGVAFIKGLQGDHPQYLKAAACAKHFAVHSGPEAQREEFNAQVGLRDLWDTYLPAFEACVTEGKVESVMGAYNCVNSQPCNGSTLLIGEILRDKWHFDGHFVSDCWAISDFHKFHKITNTPEESAAMALKNGCDLNCGDTYTRLPEAYAQGLVTEADIHRAAVRLMRTRMRLGLFDKVPEFDGIDFGVNDCEAHREAALRCARKSMVLLKNDGLLPLDLTKLKKGIAVIGPNSNCRVMLQGNYHGDASRYVTIAEGIQDYAGDAVRVYWAQGCHKTEERYHRLAAADDRISEAVIIARRSDVAVVCLGLDETIEGEQSHRSTELACGDRLSIELPPHQERLLKAVQATGTPVILMICAGSAMAVPWADENVNAIISAWYPGASGGRAAAELIFGAYSPAGRLPVTYYRSTADLPDFSNYAMDNRTYRYFNGIPLYPFGFGLSYTTFAYSGLKLEKNRIKAGESLTFNVDVKNTGNMDGDEVVQVYIKNRKSLFKTPRFSLCGFKRISLRRGETQSVSFNIAPEAMRVISDCGERLIIPGELTLYVGGSQPDERSRELTGIDLLSVIFEVE